MTTTKSGEERMDNDGRQLPARLSWTDADGVHSCWFGDRCVGSVTFRPIALVGRPYHWECDRAQGNAKTLRRAKTRVELTYLKSSHGTTANMGAFDTTTCPHCSGNDTRFILCHSWCHDEQRDEEVAEVWNNVICEYDDQLPIELTDGFWGDADGQQ
jgi:hypothetical protein